MCVGCTSYNDTIVKIVMLVYKSRRYGVRRYGYGGSGIVDMIGSLLVRYVTKAMLLKVSDARYIRCSQESHSTLLVRSGKKEIDTKHSQKPQLKKASVDTGRIDKKRSNRQIED